MARRFAWGALAGFVALVPASTQAAVRITEFMYQGAGGADREFIELTNISATAVDVSGWSYNDNNPNDPVVFGDAFGTLAANESVILTEMTAAAFRSYWNLGSSVRIFSIGGNSNLGGSDTINIYSSATQNGSTLVDAVSYTGTTRGISRNRPDAQGDVLNAAFVNSSANDVYGSYLGGTVAGDRDLGNPGSYPFDVAAVPEPASWALMIGGFGLVGAQMRRRVRFAARSAA
jgi:hypothetical protein